jgi:hypothetical protein
LSSFSAARPSHGVGAAAAPRSMRAMLPIMGVPPARLDEEPQQA